MRQIPKVTFETTRLKKYSKAFLTKTATAWYASRMRRLNPDTRITGCTSSSQRLFTVHVPLDSKSGIIRIAIRITTDLITCVTAQGHRIFLMQWSMELISRLARLTARKDMNTMRKILTFSRTGVVTASPVV